MTFTPDDVTLSFDQISLMSETSAVMLLVLAFELRAQFRRELARMKDMPRWFQVVRPFTYVPLCLMLPTVAVVGPFAGDDGWSGWPAYLYLVGYLAATVTVALVVGSYALQVTLGIDLDEEKPPATLSAKRGLVRRAAARRGR